MLKQIPARIMRSTITLKACTGIDRYQKQTFQDYTVKKVHLQPTNEIRKTANNTDCTLRSILFADRNSKPNLNWPGLFKAAHKIAGDLKVITDDGEEYTVFTVDILKDDTDQFHHYEIGLR